MPGSKLMTPRVHILGAGGQLAHALVSTMPDNYDKPGRIALYQRKDCDFIDPRSFEKDTSLALHSGDVVINCAAYTDVDAAEDDPEGANKVNAQAPAALARLCNERGAHLIHLSTDYVFSGKDIGRPWETFDPTGATTVYGVSKAAGEAAVLDECSAAVVIRTAWLFTGPLRSSWGLRSNDFVTTIQKLYQVKKKPLQVVDDQFGSPTYSMDLARGIWEVVGRMVQSEEFPRILHATNGGTTTWYSFASEIVGLSGGKRGRIMPCSSKDYPTKAERPHWSVLSPASWEDAGLTPLRHWKKALAEALIMGTNSLS